MSAVGLGRGGGGGGGGHGGGGHGGGGGFRGGGGGGHGRPRAPGRTWGWGWGGRGWGWGWWDLGDAYLYPASASCSSWSAPLTPAQVTVALQAAANASLAAGVSIASDGGQLYQFSKQNGVTLIQVCTAFGLGQSPVDVTAYDRVGPLNPKCHANTWYVAPGCFAGDYMTTGDSEDSEQRAANANWVHNILGVGLPPAAGLAVRDPSAPPSCAPSCRCAACCAQRDAAASYMVDARGCAHSAACPLAPLPADTRWQADDYPPTEGPTDADTRCAGCWWVTQQLGLVGVDGRRVDVGVGQYGDAPGWDKAFEWEEWQSYDPVIGSEGGGGVDTVEGKDSGPSGNPNEGIFGSSQPAGEDRRVFGGVFRSSPRARVPVAAQFAAVPAQSAGPWSPAGSPAGLGRATKPKQPTPAHPAQSAPPARVLPGVRVPSSVEQASRPAGWPFRGFGAAQSSDEPLVWPWVSSEVNRAGAPTVVGPKPPGGGQEPEPSDAGDGDDDEAAYVRYLPGTRVALPPTALVERGVGGCGDCGFNRPTLPASASPPPPLQQGRVPVAPVVMRNGKPVKVRT